MFGHIISLRIFSTVRLCDC